MGRLLDTVSTRPRLRSYQWGGHASYFARATFFGFYVLRLLSPLQWLKYLYREKGRAQSTTNVRPDFPAAFSELYFLIVLAVAGGGAVCRATLGAAPGWTTVPLKVLAAIFLVESIVWVVYYLLLRSLVEGSYTIYHPAEYLLTFPVLIATQTLLVSLVWGDGVTTVLAALTGNPDTARPLLVALSALGLVYLTAALSVLMTSHPGIEPRRPQSLAVIGAGDVALNRILPALAHLDVPPRDVVVAALVRPGESLAEAARAQIGDARLLEASTEDELMREIVSEETPVVVASPTAAHFRQIVRLGGTGVRFAVEKPIVGAAAEREVLRLNPALMAEGFALSYYVLEKALPLTYFATPLPGYRKYLVSDPPELLDGPSFQFLRDSLGAIKRMEVTLLEGHDRSPGAGVREWTEQPPNLRPFVETGVHPLAVARTLLADADPEWRRVVTGVYGPRQAKVPGGIAPTFLQAEGCFGTSEFAMTIGKYIATPPRRGAVVTHYRGSLVADFDARSLQIDVDGRTAGTIRVGDEWSENYSVQMDLVRTFMLRGHGSVRHDDFARQLDALAWWDTLCDWADRESVVPFVYDDNVDPIGIAASAASSP